MHQLLGRLQISSTKGSFRAFFEAHDRGDGKVDVRRFLQRLLPKKSLSRKQASTRNGVESKTPSKADKKLPIVVAEPVETPLPPNPIRALKAEDSSEAQGEFNESRDADTGLAPSNPALKGLRVPPLRLSGSMESPAQLRSAIDRLMLSPRAGVVYTGQPRSLTLDPHSEFLRQKYSISQKATSTNNQLYGAFFKPYSKLRRNMQAIERKHSGESSPSRPLPPRESQSSGRSPRITAIRDKPPVSLQQVLANTFR